MTSLLLDPTPPASYQAPVLDANQQKVVDHRRGAMRVLAGPGTGKTTTLVAAMAGRLQGSHALRPDQVLGLTFGRRAALQWRDQVTAAIGGGAVPSISTFHSFCYALLRRFAPQDEYLIATRLLSGPEQQVRAQDLFVNAVREGRIEWSDELADAVGTRGLTEEIRAVMSRARSHGLEPVDLDRMGKQGGLPLWSPVAHFMEEYLDVLGFEGVLDYSELIYRAMLLAEEDEVREFLHRTYAAVFVDEYQDTLNYFDVWSQPTHH
jgi:superfamily I DNA/RNA helicase